MWNQCWTCVSVERMGKSECSEPSRKQARRDFFPLEVCCENSDAAWQTESCCIQGKKKQQPMMAQKLQGSWCCKEEKKIRAKSCTVNSDSLVFLKTDTTAKGSREKNLMLEWSGSLNLKGNGEKGWTPAHLQQHCTQSLPDLGLVTVMSEALGRQIAQQACFVSMTYSGACTACMLNASGWIWLRL